MDNIRTMIFKVIFMITMILNNSLYSNELGFYYNADTNNQMNHSSDNLKAYLFYKEVEFQKTHNLVVLIGMCANINTDFMNLIT